MLGCIEHIMQKTASKKLKMEVYGVRVNVFSERAQCVGEAETCWTQDGPLFVRVIQTQTGGPLFA